MTIYLAFVVGAYVGAFVLTLMVAAARETPSPHTAKERRQ